MITSQWYHLVIIGLGEATQELCKLKIEPSE